MEHTLWSHPFLRRVARRIEKAKRPNIKESIVSHPDLIDPSATVTGAHLIGPVRVGEYAHIKRDTLLRGEISIGRYTAINGPHTDILCEIDSVQIGAFCSIARNVAIQEYNHRAGACSTCFVLSRVLGHEDACEVESKGPISIGNDVWIGTQCVILSGSKIGDGAIIAANSVVTAPIPPYAIAAGSPAKVLRYRFSDAIIERLLELEWWRWSRAMLEHNRALFEGDLTEEKLDSVQACQP